MSQSAERAVLGAVLWRPQVYGDIAQIVSEKDFSNDAHRVIWRVAADMINNGDIPDVVTLPPALEAAGLMNQAGGVSYVAGLWDELPDVANAAHYANLVREASLRRALTRLSVELAGAAGDQTIQVAEILDAASARLAKLQGAGFDGKAEESLGDVAAEEMDRIKREANGEAGEALMTGFDQLDQRLRGLRGGQLIIIGARPGVGKTSFALNIGINVALAGKRVLFISLEMSREELARRALCMLSRVGGGRLARGGVGSPYAEQDWVSAQYALDQLRVAHIVLVDREHVTPGQIRSRCRSLQLRGGLDLLIVDYLQLMRSGERHGGRVEEVGAISRNLKLLARDLEVPIIAPCQLNREMEKRADPRALPTEGRSKGEPRMADLRESGSIENDADVVILLHRIVEGGEAEIRDCAAIIAKQRTGPTGRLVFRFDPPTCRFEEGR